MTALALVTPPVDLAVSLAEVKEFIDVDIDDHDDLIEGLLVAAIEFAEGFTARAFITQTWDYYVDEFSRQIEIPKPPLISVGSITYTDEAGTSQTASSSLYVADAYSVPGRVYLDYLQSWPTTRPTPHAVKIRFTAGYGGNPLAVPAMIRTAIKMIVASGYDNREDFVVAQGFTSVKVPQNSKSLLWPHRWRL